MKRNAFFQLVHKEDGTYLKSYPAVDGGLPLNEKDIRYYFDLKKIDIDNSYIKRFVQEAANEDNYLLKFTSKQLMEENGTVIVTISPDRRLAKIRMYPPSSKGRRLSFEDVMDRIGQAGIRSGILENNVKAVIRGGLYCMDVLCARAKAPKEGHDAYIDYFFNVNKINKPALNPDGSVNYHDLNMIENVSTDTLLARLTPADHGAAGEDVLGMPIEPHKVREMVLKYGRNIRITEDGTEIYSEVNGDVMLVNDTVFVNTEFKVDGDVGPVTGDIDFDGSIVIPGNILAGYTVKATGDIIVNGDVEGATLESGGKIVLKRGMSGMGKGELKAKGDVISNFIENAKVHAGGKVYADAILGSEVSAGSDIIVSGKRGVIAGSQVSSATAIRAINAGTDIETFTELDVGIDHEVRERYHFLEKEVDNISKERETLEKNVNLLKKRLASKGSLEPPKLKQLKDSAERMKEIDSLLEQYTDEFSDISEKIEESQGGVIVISGRTYPGVKLCISDVSTFIHGICQNSRFVREGADIRVKAAN
jgi:uncharacterized protein (DUF342 family)